MQQRPLYQGAGGWRVAPPPSLNPADALRRRGDLASTGRQPISLAPTAQWVTSGEDWSSERQPRQKILQGAMPQGRSRSSSSKQPDTYPTPAWKVAGVTNLLQFFSEMRPKVLRAATLVSGPTAAWGLLASWMRKRLRSIGGRPLMMTNGGLSGRIVLSSYGANFWEFRAKISGERMKCPEGNFLNPSPQMGKQAKCQSCHCLNAKKLSRRFLC